MSFGSILAINLIVIGINVWVLSMFTIMTKDCIVYFYSSSF